MKAVASAAAFFFLDFSLWFLDFYCKSSVIQDYFYSETSVKQNLKEMEESNLMVPEGISIPSFTSTRQHSEKYLSEKYPEFLAWLVEFYPFAKDLRERIYLYKHGMLEAPKCPVCGKYCHLTGSMRYTSHCSPRCGQDDPETKKKTRCSYEAKTEEEMEQILSKRKSTNLERYGVDCVSKLEENKEKARKTSLERYGTESPRQSAVVKEKVRNTCIERYGVDNPRKAASVKRKIRETCLDRYGVDNPMKSVELVEKRRRTNLEKFGTENPGNTPEAIEKRKKTSMERYGYDNPSKSPTVKKRISKTSMDRYGTKWPCLIPSCRETQSDSKYNLAFEKILVDLGLEKGKDFTREFEIDGLMYDFKVGDILVEINPSETHNSTWGNMKYPNDRMSNMKLYTPKKKTYHIGKMRLAEQYGYRCITVWEWDNPEKVAELLIPRCKIYARDCSVRVLVPGEEKDFLEENHLQGSCSGAEYSIGLYSDSGLVEVMTFGKPRYNKNYQWELLRLCTKKGHTVVGGTEKIFKFFLEKKNPESIISYCDLSKFSGDIYNRLGFVLNGRPEPSKHWSLYRPHIIKDYSDPENPVFYESSDPRNKNAKPHITDNFLRSRGYDQIFKTDIGKGVSNEALMEQSGYVLVYDCGQATYIWRKPD